LLLTLVGADLNQLMSLAARLHPYFPSATVLHTDAVIDRAVSAAEDSEGPVLVCLDSLTGIEGHVEIGRLVFLAKCPAQAEVLRQARLKYVLLGEPDQRLVQVLRGGASVPSVTACVSAPVVGRGKLSVGVGHRWARRTARRDKHGR
jgi:hypothetical protein